MFRLLALFGLCLAAGPAAAAEEPPYSVVLQEGSFEIRDYPALALAEVAAPGDRNSAAYSGFRTLAGYIFGGNARRQSIEMTAPVIELRAGATAEPTGPSSDPRMGHQFRHAARTCHSKRCRNPTIRRSPCGNRVRPASPSFGSPDSRGTILSPQRPPSSKRFWQQRPQTNRTAGHRPIRPSVDALVHAAQRDHDSGRRVSMRYALPAGSRNTLL